MPKTKHLSRSCGEADGYDISYKEAYGNNRSLWSPVHMIETAKLP